MGRGVAVAVVHAVIELVSVIGNLEGRIPVKTRNSGREVVFADSVRKHIFAVIPRNIKDKCGSGGCFLRIPVCVGIIDCIVARCGSQLAEIPSITVLLLEVETRVGDDESAARCDVDGHGVCAACRLDEDIRHAVGVVDIVQIGEVDAPFAAGFGIGNLNRHVAGNEAALKVVAESHLHPYGVALAGFDVE